MPSPTLPHPFNGINAATGDYGLTLSADQRVQRVFGHAGQALSQRQRDEFGEAQCAAGSGERELNNAEITVGQRDGGYSNSFRTIASNCSRYCSTSAP